MRLCRDKWTIYVVDWSKRAIYALAGVTLDDRAYRAIRDEEVAVVTQSVRPDDRVEYDAK